MVSFMGSLVYDWLLSAGDEKLAKKFKKEAKAEPLPPNSPRLADIVKHYKETSPQKRKAEPVVNGSAKKAKKVRSSLLSSLFKSCPQLGFDSRALKNLNPRWTNSCLCQQVQMQASI